jgi:hypothetical protein
MPDITGFPLYFFTSGDGLSLVVTIQQLELATIPTGKYISGITEINIENYLIVWFVAGIVVLALGLFYKRRRRRI